MCLNQNAVISAMSMREKGEWGGCSGGSVGDLEEQRNHGMRDKGKRAPENIFKVLSVSNEVVKESIIMQNDEKKHTYR